jgi:hypothetical protein
MRLSLPEGATSLISYFASFSRKRRASFRACASYAEPSFHVARGERTESGTPGTLGGMGSPKIGSGARGASWRAPVRMARTIARV